MSDTTTVEAVRMKFRLLEPLMTERMRRQWAACEAESLGRGGVNLVARATGLSRTTIWAGRRELRRRADRPQEDLTPERVRAPGGGRHLVEQDDPALLGALRDLVELSTRGDPQSPLFWTCKSTRRLAEELGSQGHSVSHQTVAALLSGWGYSLQANRKTKEGQDHPDRDAQFEHINRRVRDFQRGASRSSRWMRRRRSWSGIFAIRGGNGSRTASRRRSAPRTSWTSSWARRSPRGSMTCAATRGG